MGVDIHMSIISKNGDYRYSDLFDGIRDSEWFDNICDKYHTDEIYDIFPRQSGIPSVAPENIKKDFNEKDYYDFFYVRVGDFLQWFDKMRPDVDAGWISTYEVWLYNTKGIAPRELPHELDEDCNPLDYHFTEIENPNDNSRELFEFITEHKDIDLEDFIIYYFDN